ncbi:MAG: hypothetical protein GC192_09170 [Bacteroidetes bacterium]|nr:hypothetical protein [Bacteroidota bacterium]
MKKLNWIQILAFFLLFKLAFHLYLNGQWSFHRDGLLYLALGRHLDWGYASVPAGIGFWAWLSGEVLGGDVWVVRLFSTLFGTGTVLLTGLMAKEMLPKNEENGRFSAFIIGLAGLVCGAFLRPCMLFQPVVFDIFYWTLLCWLFLKYLNTSRNSWLLWFGVAAGIGLLNKYTVFMLLFAMLPGILFTKNRQLLTNKNLYFTAGLALLIFSPNIAWQVAHKFPVFRHMSELAATQFTHVSISGILLDQLTFFASALPVWLCGLYFLLFKKAAAPWRIFGWMYLMVLAVLVFFNAKSYYSLGAYPVLLAAGAAYMEQLSQNKYRWIRFAIPAFMLVIGAMGMPISLPLFPPAKEAEMMKKLAWLPGLESSLRWEDGEQHTLPQDFADMIGWEELGEKVGETWQQIPDKSTAAIYAENYGQAAAIEKFGKPFNVPDVISFSDNYRYWLPDSLPHDFKTLIYVNDELGDDMNGFFQDIEKVWELDMPLSRQHGNQIYICQNPTPAFFNRIGTAISQAKQDMIIDD